MRVALFATCFNDTLFPGTPRAVVTILERLGHSVEFPTAQACCGQMHFNTGYQREAIPMVRRFADVFAGYEAVVAPSGSCAGMIRDYHHRVAERADDPGLLSAVEGYSGRVHELSEFLVDVAGVIDVGAHFPHRVTYHPTCHSLRMLRVGDKPLQLLGAVGGIELVDLPAAEECCGFGGTFAVKNSAVSMAMAMDKLDNVVATGATYLCASDNSCLMHVGGALSRHGRPVKPIHLAEILAATQLNPFDPNGSS